MKVSELLAARFDEINRVRERPPVQDNFSFVLRKLSDESLSARLHALIGDISEQGKKIARHADFNDFKNYRRMVKEFINEVLTHSHMLNREDILNRRGKHKTYTIIRVINQDLDDLARELLKIEKDHLTILEKIDELQGLLLDLLT